MTHLHFRKIGDKATGEPCIVPRGLNYCEVCNCYTRTMIKIVRVDGYPYPVCSTHSVDEVKLWTAAISIEG